MEMAEDSYNFLNKYSDPFGLKEIIAMGGQSFVRDKKCFLSEKIPCSIVSSFPLVDRLNKAGEPAFLPYPFIFSPARKQLLNELFPEEIRYKHLINLIKGVSQAGKSNFACHLALMLRRKPFQCAVIYIGNMAHFNAFPIEHCTKELFYWFHEEIKESLVAQILIRYALEVDSVNSKLELLGEIIGILIRICKKKKKIIYFIEDQFYNLQSDQAKLVELKLRACDYRILVSSNNDYNASQEARPDAGNAIIFKLDERKNPIEETELQNIIAQLHPGIVPKIGRPSLQFD